MKRNGLLDGIQRPLVYVAGIFTIGPYYLVIKRQREPYKHHWALPTQLIAGDIKPTDILQQLAADYGDIEIEAPRIVTMEPHSYRQDGIEVRALQIIYTAAIANKTRPEIDTWGAEHTSSARMVHRREYGLELGFGHEHYVSMPISQDWWK